MQADRDEVQELCALLRSRFPIILIQSHEEPRILELLAKAANLESQILMTWSITCGIRRHGRDEAIYQTNDLLDMLKHIDKTAQNGIYVLCDAHPGFKDPISMRLIREIALSHSKSARTLVFISPRLDELPSEVLRYRLISTLSCRSRGVRMLVQDEAKRYEKQRERPRGDKHALEMLIMHLLAWSRTMCADWCGRHCAMTVRSAKTIYGACWRRSMRRSAARLRLGTSKAR